LLSCPRIPPKEEGNKEVIRSFRAHGKASAECFTMQELSFYPVIPMA
jgi:hypothetical protein